MLIVHDGQLRRHPAVFQTLTGLRVAEFDALARDLAPAIAVAPTPRRRKEGERQRAPGAGGPFRLSPRTQLLLTLVWLRQYPTTPVLGFLFGVHTTTAQRTLHRVLPVLEADGRAQLERARPDPEAPRPPRRRSRRTLEELLRDVPDLAVIVDTFEQRVQRPKGKREDGTRVADAFYSGKKKQHTMKSQVTVDAHTGKFVDVPESVPGPTSDLTLLKQSGLLDRLPPDVGLGGDLAYIGAGALHPQGLGFTPRRRPRSRPRPPDDVAYNTAFASWRIEVEHSIGRLRRFQSLTLPDREHRQRHTARVAAAAGLVNRQIDHRFLGVAC